MAEFQSSAIYMRGVVRAMAHHGKTEAVRKLASPAGLAMMDNTSAQGWWPQRDVVPLCEAIYAVGGEDLIIETGRYVMKDSVSSVIQPLFKVIGALGVVSPPTLFTRFSQFSSMAIRNIDISWTSTGEREGELVIEYPPPVPDWYGLLWVGPIEHAFELAGRKGAPPRVVGRDARFTFALSWS